MEDSHIDGKALLHDSIKLYKKQTKSDGHNCRVMRYVCLINDQLKCLPGHNWEKKK